MAARIKRDVYQDVTNKILALMEQHGTDWNKPWRAAGGNTLPVNIVSGKHYRGINIAILLSSGYENQVWGTYKQWKDKGAQVRKGERSTQIVFWKPMTIEDKETGEEKDILFARGYCVFNVAQVDGYELTVTDDESAEFEPHDAAQAVLDGSGAVIRHGQGGAFYVPSQDYIGLPFPETFLERDGYYATALHELTHWTGHKSRCDRDFKPTQRFGDEAYAFEELVAELGAAFLCASTGISAEPRPDHAKYLNSWIKVLKHDKKAIFTAASKAQQAVDYIHEIQGEVAEAA